MWQASKLQLLQIYKYALLGYSPIRIANLLGLISVDRDSFMYRVQQEGTEEYRMYVLGDARGGLASDQVLTDIINGSESEDADVINAIKELGISLKAKKVRDLKKTLFGL